MSQILLLCESVSVFSYLLLVVQLTCRGYDGLSQAVSPTLHTKGLNKWIVLFLQYNMILTANLAGLSGRYGRNYIFY